MKNIAIIGTVGIPARYGGFETFAEQLITRLSKKYNFLIFCSKPHYRSRATYHGNARRIFLPFRANGYQSVLYDIFSIIYSLFKADTLLILGVSGCIILPLIKIFHNKRIIVSVDGLDTKREKWSKIAKIFLSISEKIAVKYSDIVIADNPYIQKYIAEKYNCQSELIEYGSDHSINVQADSDDLIKYPFVRDEYALAIARIEKENHSDIILNAFSENSRIKLVYVGTWDTNNFSRDLYERYQSNENIVLLHPIYDAHDINLIRSNASIFIHGNGSGGTNPGLLEAMHVGLPIIAYDVNFNHEVTRNNALFFRTDEELISSLKSYVEDDNLVEKNKSAVRKVARKHYSWDAIIKKYEQIL